jgi:ABC-type multidrug transport system ATPase subunit
MPDILLQTYNLSKRYKARWAVDDVNLVVHRGEVFGFLGPNGAGKSTTIRMLLSLVRPTRGHVELFGKSLLKHRREILAQVGGFVEHADFYLYLTARRNLEIVAALQGGISTHAIEEAIDSVGLGERADEKVKTYSHGMKQRLGIAQALLGNPQFIILDEPTSGLDPQGIKEVRELINRLSAERAITIFLSSHLLSEIEQTATSMAIINQGKLIVQGKVKELLNTSDNVVKIEAQPIEQAFAIAERQTFVKGLKRSDHFLEVKMSFSDIGKLNAALVENGVEVRALLPKRSLEEYFLSITEGATDIAPSFRRKKPL